MTDCTLCGLPTPTPPISDGDVDGIYCCQGCLAVARRLETVDGTAAATGTDVSEALDTGPDDAPGETAVVHVEGMHCTACEAFLEARATDCDGVRAARASYPTGILSVTYDSEALDPATLPERLSGHGYGASLDPEQADTDDPTGRLLVGGFFGMLVMLWYLIVLYPSYLDVDPVFVLVDPAGPAGRYVLLKLWVLSGVVLGYTGRPILHGALVSLRTRQPTMDLLVALAATTAFAYSTLVVLLGGTEVYFDVATVIVLAVTLGGYYRDRYRSAALGHLEDLTDERPAVARLATADGAETVARAAVDGGDRLVVGTGERVPVDGTVESGTAAVDRSLVTGESVPRRRTPGDEVVGGALVTEGHLELAAAEGGESTADRLVETLHTLRAGSGGVQRLVDRLAVVFVPLVLFLAVATVLGHLALGGLAPTGAVLAGLAVLVVSCPCALGLATPLAVTAGVRDALAAGVVLTGEDVLERAPDVDTVVFDKTGTLTTGEMTVLNDPAPEALRRAAPLEAHADHPIAAAIVEAAPGPGTDEAADATAVSVDPGLGVRGTVDGERVLVGRPALFQAEGWGVPDELDDAAAGAREAGSIPALVGWDGEARDVVVAGDEPRPGWDDVVDEIAADREVVVLTGDGDTAAERFRTHAAVDEVFADVPPEGKAAVVERLRERGTVAVVGDGSNDAPALAAADVGIALAHGTALAAQAADAVVLDDDLAAVPTVFALPRATKRRIRQNLGWALTYNGLAVPLAVAGLLNPLFAAVAMATSSVLVVTNSARSLGLQRRG